MSNRSHFLKLILGGLIGCASLLFATTALAHADLIGADPAPNSVVPTAPAQVRLFFSEPLVEQFFALEVYDQTRVRVDRGDARVSPSDLQVLEATLISLNDGVYTVKWRVLSLDDHVVQGSFVFGVGLTTNLDQAASDRTTTGDSFVTRALLRWVTYVGAFVLIGGFTFPLFVLGPVFHRFQTETSVRRRIQRIWLAVLWLAVIVLLVAAFAALLYQAASLSGVALTQVFEGQELIELLSTRYGYLWLLRVGLLLGIVAVLAVMGANNQGGAGIIVVGSVLSAGVILTISSSGHANTVGGQTLVLILSDWAHLVSGGVWLGGLLQLAITLLVASRLIEPVIRQSVIAYLVPRFSWFAGVSVAVLVLTGAIQGVVYVGSWAGLIDTVYGATLSTKILAVGLPLVIAAFNLLVLSPRLRQNVRTMWQQRMHISTERMFQYLVGGEILLALLVVAITAVLTGLPPASTLTPAGISYSSVRHTNSYGVGLDVAPNQVGENTIEVSVGSHLLVPYDDLEQLRLRLTAVQINMGVREAELTKTGPGRYEASGNDLNVPGEWEAEITVRRMGIEEEAHFDFTVGRAQSRPSFSPARAVADLVTGERLMVVAAVGIVLIGLGLVVQTAYITDLRSADGTVRIISLVIAIVAGLLLVYRKNLSLPTIDLMTLIGLGIILFGVGLVAYVVRSVSLRSVEGSALILASLVVMALGAYLAIQAQVSIGAASSTTQLTNTFPPTQESLAIGQRLYTETGCHLCHGISGRGDGPAGLALRPPPADFRVHMAAGHTDAQLFIWLSEGVQRTAMPAFMDRLTVEERWHVLNFLRTFAQN